MSVQTCGPVVFPLGFVVREGTVVGRRESSAHAGAVKS